MSKTKTLKCEGPPAHFWEFTPKGPGRPPKFCEEHRAGAKHHYENEIIDTNTYHNDALAGIKIHGIRRDHDGVWYCNLTCGDETFDLVRNGGWMILHDGGMKEALPNVSAAIQACVVKLEPKLDPDEKKGKRKSREEFEKNMKENPEQALADHQQDLLDNIKKREARKSKKTLEQVADEIAPVPTTPDTDIQVATLKTCECCDRQQEPNEKGWIVDPEEGVDLCPECAKELGSEEDNEDEQGYNDLLSNPEQYDDKFDDMADAFSALDFELGE